MQTLRNWLPMALVAASLGNATEVRAQPAARDFRQLPTNTWTKLSPLADTSVSPRLGYEGACVWDSWRQRLIRYGGHNQGGGGEQGSELWSFDPLTARWALHEPNISPPGICCGQQNVFDPVAGRYVRFPAFSASHGWQWQREVALNDSSVWTFDLEQNRWRNLRPVPTMRPGPLRCASWDAEFQVVVLFGGEGNSEGTAVYDPWENRWTSMRPKIEPEFRSGGNMAYDARHRVHVLFGSQFSNDPHTWVYDLRTNTWRDMQPTLQPSTDKNDAVLTYDSSAGVIVALIKVTTGEDEQAVHRLETWTYDVGANRWMRMNPDREPDPTGNRARQLLFATELGVTLLENRPSRPVAEQQIWAYRLSPRDSADAGLEAPRRLAVSIKDHSAVLTWKAPAVVSQAWQIERGAGDQPWSADFQTLTTVDGQHESFEDSGVAPGRVHFYRVRAATKDGRAGPPSQVVRTQPRAVEDVTVSVLAADKVEIAWQPSSAAQGIVGYHVERAVVEVLSDDELKPLKSRTPVLPQPSIGAIRRIGPFVRRTATPVEQTTFQETDVDLRDPTKLNDPAIYERKFNDEQLDRDGRAYPFAVYAYRVLAVNSLGVLSGASPAVLTVPSSPQFVFSNEDGEACQIRWEANRERGVRGYRVYRMDGRYDKDPVTRLTTEPISELVFTDPAAGKPTRRYYVVAVDSLGQEGFPSSPVWHNREWAQFYVPFVGEWHQ